MTDGFSTIKVQRHREEDVVMRAGAWPSDDAAAKAPAPAATDTSAPAAESATAAPVAAPAVAPAPAEAAARPAAAEPAFRETTLEDIETSKMPALQKGIIVTAMLAVVACIVWYALFMS